MEAMGRRGQTTVERDRSQECTATTGRPGRGCLAKRRTGTIGKRRHRQRNQIKRQYSCRLKRCSQIDQSVPQVTEFGYRNPSGRTTPHLGFSAETGASSHLGFPFSEKGSGIESSEGSSLARCQIDNFT